MATLLLHLVAPMQSYGMRSKFDRRTTENVPTKSAVIGMIAAAFGWSRDHDLTILTDHLRFGIRVDQSGLVDDDFQTVHGEKSSYVTYREYIHDAKFTVGLEGEEALLRDVQTALEQPYYPLFLGRRSCPPAEPIQGEIVSETLLEALKQAPLLKPARSSFQQHLVRVVYEPEAGQATTFWKDNPVSFSRKRRVFKNRGVKEIYYPMKDDTVSYDPFDELGGIADVHD